MTKPTPTQQIDLNGITAVVEGKNIRSVRLRICRHSGDVKISAPKRVSLKEIRNSALRGQNQDGAHVIEKREVSG